MKTLFYTLCGYFWYLAPALALAFVVSCALEPKTVEIPKPPPGLQTPTPTPPPTVSPSGPSIVANISALTDLTKGSKCVKYEWGNRGSSPVGYIQGMMLVYAKALCFPKPELVANPGNASADALAWYGLKSADAKVNLRKTFLLLTGLGKRESSGKYCEGRDASAGNTAGDTAEAGLFQTSYNSHKIAPVLDSLYVNWKGNCFKDVFAQNVSCSSSNLKNYGTGEGVKFQQLEKQCPAFAAEYAALMIRLARKHYGPLNTKAAEMHQDCEGLMMQVETFVANTPSICQVL